MIRLRELRQVLWGAAAGLALANAYLLLLGWFVALLRGG
jgi:hypothetical protein